MLRRLLLLSLLAMPSVVFGQWRVGLVGGQTVNYHSASTHYMEHWEYKPLAGDLLWNCIGTVGIMGQYDFWQSRPASKGQMWTAGVRAEVDWMQKRYSLNRYFMYGHSSTNKGVKVQTGADVYANDYLTFPLMCSVSWGWPKYRVMANLGPYVAYWVLGQREGNLHLNGKTLWYDEDYTFNSERDQRWDYGVSAGIGAEWKPLPHYAIQAEARCYRSMQSTTKDYMTNISDPRYDTTLAFQIALLYLF